MSETQTPDFGAKAEDESRQEQPSLNITELTGDKFREVIPQEFREKPYWKDIDSFQTMVKSLDGAQSLLGRKSAPLPGEGASDEDYVKFYRSAGMPEKPDEYQFKMDDIPEDRRMSDEEQATLRNAFHKAKLTKYQSDLMFNELSGIGQKSLDRIAQINEQRDQELDKIYGDIFKGEKDSVLAQTKKLIESSGLPQPILERVVNLDNDSLTVVAALTHQMYKKHVAEDGLLSSGEPATTESVDDLRDRIHKINAEYRKTPQMNVTRREQLLKKREEMYNELARAQKSA